MQHSKQVSILGIPTHRPSTETTLIFITSEICPILQTIRRLYTHLSTPSLQLPRKVCEPFYAVTSQPLRFYKRNCYNKDYRGNGSPNQLKRKEDSEAENYILKYIEYTF